MSRCLPALLERALQMNSDVRVRALLCRHTSCCTNGARVHVRTTDAVCPMMWTRKDAWQGVNTGQRSALYKVERNAPYRGRKHRGELFHVPLGVALARYMKALSPLPLTRALSL